MFYFTQRAYNGKMQHLHCTDISYLIRTQGIYGNQNIHFW